MPEMETTEQLFRQHYTAMYRMAMMLLKDEEASKDTVSDIFADIIHGNISVREEQTPEERVRTRSFLLRCTRNRCLNLLDRMGRGERICRMLTLETAPSIAPAEPQEDHLEAILHFIDRELTPQTRQVILLRFREQLKYREIAERLGISEVAVYKHLSQGIKQIQKQFKP